MRRLATLVAVALALAACGADGDPERLRSGGGNRGTIGLDGTF